MQPVVHRWSRPVVALTACAALVLVATAGVFAANGPSYAKRGPFHCVEEGGYIYTFDAVWRVEGLRRVDRATGLGVPSTDPDRLARLRSALLRKLKLKGLEGVPAEGKAELAAVRALGYL